ncbi:phage protein NinX family protein [Xenorhabdus sp. Sc-CR9]|uniref:phage protein NinX family protein n=1 Tax=Xenorhabdus sp. Sc-CR9 TaxID=2584468 RepID=UPI001F327592|nr:phage protein NinX family protein [Xenorhabdus sp. Sc-CR9]
MKLKTSELTGRALDYAVGLAVTDDDVKCDGQHISVTFNGGRYIYSWNPATNWEQCGQLIEKYITALALHTRGEHWIAGSRIHGTSTGETAQISICREVVRNQLGDEVEIPDELLEGE